MKRSSSGLSRMSSYRYGEKKKVWKWTTGKIVAFSAFGLMIATLFYIESGSRQVVSQDQSLVNEPVYQAPEPSDFEKEYQEFLSQGQKLITQDKLDSLVQSQSDVEDTDRAEINLNSSINPVAVLQEQSGQKSPTVNSPETDKSVKTADKPVKTQVESNLKPVPLTASNGGGTSVQNQNIIGGLEEIDPSELATTYSTQHNEAEATNEVITEEFYIEETIKGKISAASNRSPLQGVTITVKGTNIQTVSDSNGNYSITVPGDPLYRTLRYSYLGNTTEREVAPGTEILNIRF